MNIVEVKNNLIKLCYENELKLSELILVKDAQKTFIAQIIHLEATRVGKTAVAKILFCYDGQLHTYNGSIPSLRAQVQILNPADFLKHLKHDNPLTIGQLSSGENIVVDLSVLEDNPVILSEKSYSYQLLLNNIALQLLQQNKKAVIFDVFGVFKSGKFKISKDFKLPLNSSTVDYIYEKGFEDATDESKMMIQSIFEELSEYAKTVEYIPFNTFKSVVDSEFAKTKLIQLVILKNRIKQIQNWNVFAEKEEEFKAIKQRLETENLTVFDISSLNEHLQGECIKYVYSVMNEIQSDFYVFTPLNSQGFNKNSLQNLFESENIHTSVICDYNLPYLTELKKRSKNMLMFTPVAKQEDFGGYNYFINKLAEDEFIVYGKMTKFIPLISKLVEISPEDIKATTEPEEEQPLPVVEEQSVETEETIDIQQEEPVTAEIKTEDIPEEIPTAYVNTEETIQENIQEKVVEPEIPAQEPIVESSENIIDETEIVEETNAEENDVQSVNILDDKDVEINTLEETPLEEIPAPDAVIAEAPEVQVAQMASASAESVVINNPSDENEIVEKVADTENNSVESALGQIPEIDDDDLSDADLDMIEALSKPNEEIPVINPENEEIAEPIPEQEVQEISEPKEVIPESEEIPEPAAEEIPLQEVMPENSSPEVELEENTQEVPDETNTVEEEPVQKAEETEPSKPEPLETREKTTPSVPEYAAEFPEEDKVNSDAIQQGDRIFHEEFGEGVVEKLINYGDKVLCSVNFPSVGRRLLNPEISEMKKI